MENTQTNKNTWKSQVGYIWAMLGSAVGFANVLSFSAKAYYNGGGAFLVPILVAYAILGVPLLILEGSVGQTFRLPLVSAAGAVAGKWGKFLAWLSVLSVATIGGYYVVITGWSIAYTYFAAGGIIDTNTAHFFSHTFLQESGNVATWGSLSGLIFVFGVIALLFTWFVTVRNIRSGIERVCSIFMPLLCALVITFAVFVCFLPGATEGFARYLIPDFAMLADPKLWLTTFGHIFFSLSLGLGIVVGYSRHADNSINVPRAMLFVALGDLTISMISGLAIFGCIGFLSHINNIPFNEVATTSTFGMGFVIFPKILHQFHPLAASIVGPLFFFSLFIAGITGFFSIVESIAGNIEVEYGLTRAQAITSTILGSFAISMFFCWGNATKLMDALEPMTAGFNMLIAGIAEVVMFMYLSDMVINQRTWITERGKRTYFYYSLKYLVPVVLTIILISSMKNELTQSFEAAEKIRWVWFALACIIAGVLANKKRKNVQA